MAKIRSCFFLLCKQLSAMLNWVHPFNCQLSATLHPNSFLSSPNGSLTQLIQARSSLPRVVRIQSQRKDKLQLQVTFPVAQISQVSFQTHLEREAGSQGNSQAWESHREIRIFARKAICPTAPPSFRILSSTTGASDLLQPHRRMTWLSLLFSSQR